MPLKADLLAFVEHVAAVYVCQTEGCRCVGGDGDYCLGGEAHAVLEER